MVYVCVYTWVCTCLNAAALSIQKKASPEPDLQVAMSHLVWLLRTELRPTQEQRVLLTPELPFLPLGELPPPFLNYRASLYLSWNLLCGPGWPRIQSAGLNVCAITTQLLFLITAGSWVFWPVELSLHSFRDKGTKDHLTSAFYC